MTSNEDISFCDRLTSVEKYLIRRDSKLRRLISTGKERWNPHPTEPLIRGLIRIVIAQQISTAAAITLMKRVDARYPQLREGSVNFEFDRDAMRSCGLSPRKADCCVAILNNAAGILARVSAGSEWQEILRGMKGVGPWTVAIFRILVLKDPDVLPKGDLGLERAVEILYGQNDIEKLSETWRPFRSVASWYLWRSLANPPLG